MCSRDNSHWLKVVLWELNEILCETTQTHILILLPLLWSLLVILSWNWELFVHHPWEDTKCIFLTSSFWTQPLFGRWKPKGSNNNWQNTSHGAPYVGCQFSWGSVRKGMTSIITGCKAHTPEHPFLFSETHSHRKFLSVFHNFRYIYRIYPFLLTTSMRKGQWKLTVNLKNPHSLPVPMWCSWPAPVCPSSIGSHPYPTYCVLLSYVLIAVRQSTMSFLKLLFNNYYLW
jgi:hypothetical protein